MTRRIISGVFLLIALGVLGVILAGALTSGEQLIVRFLTAVIVAALALYVISDMRLQANDDAAAVGTRNTMPTPRVTVPTEPPADSTAAFMATVTGRRTDETSGHPISADDFSQDAEALVGAASNAGPNGPAGPSEPPHPHAGGGIGARSPFGALDQEMPYEDVDHRDQESPYEDDLDEAAQWPFNDDVEADGPTATEQGDVDGLVAMFANQPESTPEPVPAIAAIDDEIARLDDIAALNGMTAFDGAATDDERKQPIRRRRSKQGVRPTTGEHPLARPSSATIDGDAADVAIADDLDPDTMDRPLHHVTDDTAGPSTVDPDDTPDDHDDPAAESLVESDASATDVEVADVEVTADGGRDVPARNTADTETATDDAESATANETGDDDAETTTETTTDTEAIADDASAVGDRAGSESTDLVAEAEAEAVPAPSATTVDPDDDGAEDEGAAASQVVKAAEYADGPLAPIIDLRRPVATVEGVAEAIRSGEMEVISSLINQGLLTTEGPITDRDVRTMVYVAFTSAELRKILVAGGSVDGDNSHLELGDVDVFAPARLPRSTSSAAPEAPAPAPLSAGRGHTRELPDVQAL